jgi:pimeloyl-ACP methyl ester carboxylesterase
MPTRRDTPTFRMRHDGGVLSSAGSYRPLAERLAGTFEVHVVDRRGRPGSGPQRPGHSIEDECDDLFAVIGATGASMVFGHSFGGLVALETARRRPGLESVFVYEPGVPLRGQFDLGWLDRYECLLDRGNRRGAFACMVKHAGFAPRARCDPEPLLNSSPLPGRYRPNAAAPSCFGPRRRAPGNGPGSDRWPGPGRLGGVPRLPVGAGAATAARWPHWGGRVCVLLGYVVRDGG